MADHEHEYTGPDDVCHMCGADRPTPKVVELEPEVASWLGYWLARLPSWFEELHRTDTLLKGEDRRRYDEAVKAFEGAGIDVERFAHHA